MPDSVKKTIPILLFLLMAYSAAAQKTIRGTVTDASTGDTLPSANISIENTYRGTISNRNGRYVLTIPDSLLPATVVVRYLGYHTKRLLIGAGSDEVQNVRMDPATLELGEITVTGEDPAVGIMKEVIRRKQEWRKRLETYRAEAYTRQVISNDTAIVAIIESVSEAFWDKQKGHREVQKSKRQTANMEGSQNFAGVSYFPNFYDDNIEISGFDVVGVTHPDALKFYDFKLIDHKKIDDRLVYQIEVNPARKMQPLFEGTIYVLDREYALLEVRLRPNDVVTFPPPVKDFSTFYEQQYNNFGREFWLPVDMRIDGTIKISMIGLEFPRIRFRQISQISDYQVNVPLPDSLFRKEEIFSVDSTSVAGDSLFVRSVKSVPLDRQEEEAYSKLDSTDTLDKAFKPSGFLVRFIETDDGDNNGGGPGPGFLNAIPGDLSPKLRFNRVEEFYLGIGYRVEPWKGLELRLDGGYGTGGNGEWGYGAGAEYRVFRSGDFSTGIGVEYGAHTVPQFRSRIYTPGVTTISNLLGERDYYNYYRSEGYRIFTRLDEQTTDLSATVGFNIRKHRSRPRVSGYDILGRDQGVQINPAIEAGTLHSVDLTFGYNLEEEYTLGVSGMKKIEFGIEYSDQSLGSDFNFTRYRADIDWSIPTFYRRRFLSNTLDLKITAGTYDGRLPLQKLGIIDVAIDHFGPFGGLKTRQNRPYMGEQYLMVNAEHNFRTIPFEALGLRRPADWNWGLILFGGAGKTWISDSRKQAILNRTGYLVPETGGVHLEAGISLNGLFGLFRVDFARRLDERAFMINVSVARIL